MYKQIAVTHTYCFLCTSSHNKYKRFRLTLSKKKKYVKIAGICPCGWTARLLDPPIYGINTLLICPALISAESGGYVFFSFLLPNVIYERVTKVNLNDSDGKSSACFPATSGGKGGEKRISQKIPEARRILNENAATRLGYCVGTFLHRVE